MLQLCPKCGCSTFSLDELVGHMIQCHKKTEKEKTRNNPYTGTVGQGHKKGQRT